MDEFKTGDEVTVSKDALLSEDGAEHKAKFVGYHVTDRKWADVELEAEHAGGTKRLSLPVSVLKAVLVLLTVLCSALSSRAQEIYTSPQTVDANLASNVACTGGAQNFVTGTTPGFSNLGQTQHYVTIVRSAGVNFLQAEIDGIDNQGNIFRISDVLEAAAAILPLTLTGSGRFAKIQVSVTCSPGAGTFTATYSGTSSTTNVNAGGYMLGQMDKVIAAGAPANTNSGLIQFQTPFLNSAGTIFFFFSGVGPAGSTVQVQCFGNALGINSQTFNLASNGSVQTFNVAPFPCPQMQINYVSGGASIFTYGLEYVFSQPGLSQSGTTSFPTQVNTEGQKVSYRAASSFSPPAGGATDVFVIGGSATKTVRVTHIGIACTATAAVAADVLFIKRSPADTGGTSTSPTTVALDANDPATASATVQAFTVNPTINGIVGNISADKASITTATGAPQFYFEDFGIRNTRSVVLRGTAQQLAINLNGQVVAGLACDAEVEWTEE